FFFSSRRRHTSSDRDWSSDVCSSDLTMVGAFAEGNVLQVLLVSVIVGSTLVALGSRAKAVIELLEIGSEMLFRAVAIVMWVAPIGAFGAIAFTVGRYGAGALASLGNLLACFYVVCLVFVF